MSSYLVYLSLIVVGIGIGYALAKTFSPPTPLPIDVVKSTAPATSTASPLRASPITILAVGDIMLGRSVNMNSLKFGFSWPFQLVSERLMGADLVFGNLENPIVVGCKPTDHGMIFCSPPESIEGLTSAGIDIVSLANNHSTNYGEEGLTSTKNLLTSAGISYTGLGEPNILERQGVQFAFLSYNDIGRLAYISSAEPETITSEIQRAVEISDVVIVSFHWGSEYTSSPSARQVMLAHLALDAGADVVIGTHPHWVQSEEIYQDKPIFYSLGNFIFDQEWSQKTKEGMAIQLNYQGKELVGVDRFPVLIEKYGQPHFVDGD